MSDVELLHFSEENLHTGEGARVLHQCGVPATYKIHTHDFYELFLVSHGGAIHAREWTLAAAFRGLVRFDAPEGRAPL